MVIDSSARGAQPKVLNACRRCTRRGVECLPAEYGVVRKQKRKFVGRGAASDAPSIDVAMSLVDFSLGYCGTPGTTLVDNAIAERIYDIVRERAS